MPGQRQFAISDIHGCLESFRALLDLIEYQSGDELFLLGDFIDRGPRSKGVIDFLWELQERNGLVHCLRGNHEQLLLGCFALRAQQKVWLDNGGHQTLMDFGVSRPTDIPQRYVEWMKALPLHLAAPGYVFVHAGLNFNHSDPFADETAMLWERHWYYQIDREWLGDRVVVHGHTPIPYSDIQRQVQNVATLPAINIDAGCVYERRELGHLCALELGTKRTFFQRNKDR